MGEFQKSQNNLEVESAGLGRDLVNFGQHRNVFAIALNTVDKALKLFVVGCVVDGVENVLPNEKLHDVVEIIHSDGINDVGGYSCESAFSCVSTKLFRASRLLRPSIRERRGHAADFSAVSLRH